MTLGILAGLLAGALWGLSFALPKFIHFVPGEWIAFGRFTCFGISSIIILFVKGRGRQSLKLILQKQKEFLILSLTGYSLYYVILVLSIHIIGVTLPSLIIGLLPLTTALLGQEKDRPSLPFKKLILPLGLVLLGIIAVNFDFSSDLSFKPENLGRVIVGVVLSFVSLGLWTYYAIENSREIKKSSEFSAATWTSATGIFAMLTSVVLVPLVSFFMDRSPVHELQTLINGPHVTQWLAVSIILGLGSSWFAIWLWNICAQRVSAQLAGQLIVSETVFAVLYGVILENRAPRSIEVISVFLCILGVTLAVRQFHKLPH